MGNFRQETYIWKFRKEPFVNKIKQKVKQATKWIDRWWYNKGCQSVFSVLSCDMLK